MFWLWLWLPAAERAVLRRHAPTRLANADPAESLRALDAAYVEGIRIFDTAAVYGGGEGKRLVGKALAGRSDAIVVSKIGIAVDEDTEQSIGQDQDPAHVILAIDACLKRLNRDHIDVMMLHANDTLLDQAAAVFDAVEVARGAEKTGLFGWSTDFLANINALTVRDGFSTVKHVVNDFFDVPSMRTAIEQAGCAAQARSPLVMGVLSGKTAVSNNYIRANDEGRNNYVIDGVANPVYIQKIQQVRALLQAGGRRFVQGALGRVMAQGSPYIPLPGARTVAQVEENVKAPEFGPLKTATMRAIKNVLVRAPEGPPRSW